MKGETATNIFLQWNEDMQEVEYKISINWFKTQKFPALSSIIGKELLHPLLFIIPSSSMAEKVTLNIVAEISKLMSVNFDFRTVKVFVVYVDSGTCFCFSFFDGRFYALYFTLWHILSTFFCTVISIFYILQWQRKISIYFFFSIWKIFRIMRKLGLNHCIISFISMHNAREQNRFSYFKWGGIVKLHCLISRLLHRWLSANDENSIEECGSFSFQFQSVIQQTSYVLLFHLHTTKHT